MSFCLSFLEPVLIDSLNTLLLLAIPFLILSIEYNGCRNEHTSRLALTVNSYSLIAGSKYINVKMATITF